MDHHKEGLSYAPISWKSRKIQRGVRSTLAAETLAMEEALEECFIIRSMLPEIYKRDAKSGFFLYIAIKTVNHY